mmetsp:Transcript_123475/g.348973  ORF Transcript_123475/g.348973 Transcript_123475/m.348973 type:complete len:256 (-) Transcript_123475:553-1320(-)
MQVVRGACGFEPWRNFRSSRSAHCGRCHCPLWRGGSPHLHDADRRLPRRHRPLPPLCPARRSLRRAFQGRAYLGFLGGDLAAVSAARRLCLALHLRSLDRLRGHHDLGGLGQDARPGEPGGGAWRAGCVGCLGASALLANVRHSRVRLRCAHERCAHGDYAGGPSRRPHMANFPHLRGRRARGVCRGGGVWVPFLLGRDQAGLRPELSQRRPRHARGPLHLLRACCPRGTDQPLARRGLVAVPCVAVGGVFECLP